MNTVVLIAIVLCSSLVSAATYPPSVTVVGSDYLIDGRHLVFPVLEGNPRDTVGQYADIDMDGQLDYLYRRNAHFSSCDDVLIRLSTQNLPFDPRDGSTDYLPKITGFSEFISQNGIANKYCSSPRAIKDINDDGIPDIEIRIQGRPGGHHSIYVYGKGANTTDVDISSLLHHQGFYLEPYFSFEPLWDLNGDGLLDFKINYPGAPSIIIIKGRENVSPYDADFFNFSPDDILVQANTSNLVLLTSAGDIDGDGDVETFIQTHNKRSLRFIDGSPGLSINVDSFNKLPLFPIASCEQHQCRAQPIGDIDGDGYADIVLADEGFQAAHDTANSNDIDAPQILNISIIYGSDSGFSTDNSVNTSSDYPAESVTRITQQQNGPLFLVTDVIAIGDMTGDGLDEFAFTSGNLSWVILGNKHRPEFIDIGALDGATGFDAYVAADIAGDIDGDGLIDLTSKANDRNPTPYAPRRVLLGQSHSTDSPLAPTNLRLRKAPDVTDFFWTIQGDEEPEEFVVHINGQEKYRLPGWRRSLIITQDLGVNETPQRVSIASIDKVGQLSPKSSVASSLHKRSILDLRATVYSTTAVELFFEPFKKYYSHVGIVSVIWRNGIAIAEVEGSSYFDTELVPDKTYTYVVTNKIFNSRNQDSFRRSEILTLTTDYAPTMAAPTPSISNRAPVPFDTNSAQLPNSPADTATANLPNINNDGLDFTLKPVDHVKSSTNALFRNTTTKLNRIFR